MKQSNHKNTALSGSLSCVLDHCVNSSRSELVLRGIALNSPRRINIPSPIHHETLEKTYTDQKRSLPSDADIRGSIAAGNLDNQGLSGLESQSESQSLEIRMQTSIFPAVFHNRLLSKCKEETNSSKVCQIYSNEEIFKRHLKMAAWRRQERGKTDETRGRNDLSLLNAENTNNKDYRGKEMTAESSSLHQSKRKLTSASAKKRKEVTKTGTSTRDGNKALKCALSRNNTNDTTMNEDLDYQYYDLKNLDEYDYNIGDNYDNVIDVVARENNDACGPIFPPISSNKCNIKNRYVSEFSGTPSTPFWREYTRISNSRFAEY